MDPERKILITETRHGFVCANSGIDSSNVVGDETVMLLPEDPDGSARELLRRLRSETGIPELAVIITDTFGRAWREGHVNFAIGVAGMDPFIDYRGQPDCAVEGNGGDENRRGGRGGGRVGARYGKGRRGAGRHCEGGAVRAWRWEREGVGEGEGVRPVSLNRPSTETKRTPRDRFSVGESLLLVRRSKGLRRGWSWTAPGCSPEAGCCLLEAGRG